jgi:Pyruvate/2-oxoacid:ferredoxin oxidoreductase gamma subunit
MWYPVQSTFDRVQDEKNAYLSIETILLQLEKVTKNIIVVNATEIANTAGNPLTSNLVLLGALAKTEGFPLNLNQLQEIIPKVVPKKAVEANLQAFLLGYETQK